MFERLIKHSWLTVIILFILAEVIINPIGEFPLNDDWAYSKTVKTYINSGNVKFSDWQSVPLIPQLISGIIFSNLFGFSFTVLRIISILSIILIIIVFDIILKDFDVKPAFRFILLLILTFNPLTLSLSNTFLPDVFTVLLTLAAFLFMEKFLRHFNTGNLILFIFFSICATLNRPTGIILPVIFGIIYFISQSINLKNCVIGFVPAILNIAALILFELIAEKLIELPANYNLQLNHLFYVITHPTFETFKAYSYYFITSTICLGLFILPLSISNIKYHYHQIHDSLTGKLLGICYFLIILLKVIFSGNIFPFVGNMFYHLGVGPVILTGFNTDDIQNLSILWQIIWIALNFIGGISFYCAFVSIINKTIKVKNIESNFISYFFFLLLILYLAPICFIYANDRYLLFLLPFFLLTYVLSFDFKIKKIWFCLIFIPILYFSVAGTHDYLNINKARWKATDYLTKDLNISPSEIDGGFEFNGWYLCGSKNYDASHKGRWWWIENDTYIITPIPIDGYTIESEYEFSSWISFQFNKIYVLKRNNNINY